MASKAATKRLLMPLPVLDVFVMEVLFWFSVVMTMLLMGKLKRKKQLAVFNMQSSLNRCEPAQ